MQRVDVTVIGAGVAGLRTADLLKTAGRSVTVLESRARVGGRLAAHTLAEGNARVDLGATWYWPGEHRVIDLVAELGLDSHPQHLAGDAVYHDPNGAQRLQGNPIDVPSLRFTTGAISLAEGLAARLDDDTLRLSSPATSITIDDRVRIETGNDMVESDHVVLALPPALAMHSLEFSPALPERLAGLASITPVWMGAVIKVVAVYPHAFWRQDALAGSAISHLGPMREIHDMSGPGGSPATLFGFVPNATDAPAPSEQSIRDQLSSLFGPAAGEPSELIITDWRDEPHTSPPGVERLNAYQAFGHDLYQTPSMNGRLHWASTETSRTAPGHIEGALAAAERTVDIILADSPDRPSLQGATP